MRSTTTTQKIIYFGHKTHTRFLAFKLLMLIIVKQLFLILYDFCSSVFQLTVATSN